MEPAFHLAGAGYAQVTCMSPSQNVCSRSTDSNTRAPAERFKPDEKKRTNSNASWQCRDAQLLRENMKISVGKLPHSCTGQLYRTVVQYSCTDTGSVLLSAEGGTFSLLERGGSGGVEEGLQIGWNSEVTKEGEASAEEKRRSRNNARRKSKNSLGA